VQTRLSHPDGMLG